MIFMGTLRTEFNFLIERCGCFQATQGNCHPKRCFPNLYKLAYPNNGGNVKSHLTKTQHKKPRNPWVDLKS